MFTYSIIKIFVKKLISMKREFKKIGLIAILSLFSFGGAIAQEGAKKNVIGAGVGYNMSHEDFGGHLFYNRMITAKFGVGARMFVTPFKYKDYIGASINWYNQQGTRLDFSLAANYYIVGNNDSKFGLYAGLGIGYASENMTYLVEYTGNPSIDSREYENGLSGNTTLGLNYKVGPGKIFAEFNLSYILIGNNGNTFEYPSNYPTDANGNPSPYYQSDYIQKGVSGDYTQPCLNLGYQISF